MAFDPVTSLFDLGKVLIEKLLPNPEAKAAALLKLTELQQNGDLAVIANQSDINKIEAANSNLFVSGWRPFCGWICVSALGFQALVGPAITWIWTLAGHPVILPAVQTDLLVAILTGMLGLSGLRTLEKQKGVASK